MRNARRKWWPFVAGVVIVIVAMFLILTRIGEDKSSAGEDKASPQKTYSYRLKWLANTGFIGDLYAANYGYYKEKGLNVDVKPGGPEHDAIRELQTGSAAFGVASADQVIIALNQGAEVKVIAQIYRKNPVQWIYRSKVRKMTAPADLRGRSVGITVGDNDETIMLAVLKKAGVPYQIVGEGAPQHQGPGMDPLVDLRPVRYDFAPFLKNNLELFPIYKNTQGVDLSEQLKSAGETVGFFDPDEQGGVRFVANSIVTTPRMLKENPEVVRSFLIATLKGWTDALDPQKEDLAIRVMTDHLRKSSNDREDVLTAKLRQQIKITADLVVPRPGSGLTIGAIDIAAWKETEAIMVRQGIIKSPVRIENSLATELVSGH